MAEKMKSAEAAAPLIDNGDVKKLLSLLSKVEGDRAKEFSQLIAYVDAMGRQFDRVSAELVQVRGQPSRSRSRRARPAPWRKSNTRGLRG